MAVFFRNDVSDVNVDGSDFSKTGSAGEMDLSGALQRRRFFFFFFKERAPLLLFLLFI